MYLLNGIIRLKLIKVKYCCINFQDNNLKYQLLFRCVQIGTLNLYLESNVFLIYFFYCCLAMETSCVHIYQCEFLPIVPFNCFIYVFTLFQNVSILLKFSYETSEVEHTITNLIFIQRWKYMYFFSLSL